MMVLAQLETIELDLWQKKLLSIIDEPTASLASLNQILTHTGVASQYRGDEPHSVGAAQAKAGSKLRDLVSNAYTAQLRHYPKPMKSDWQWKGYMVGCTANDLEALQAVGTILTQKFVNERIAPLLDDDTGLEKFFLDKDISPGAWAQLCDWIIEQACVCVHTSIHVYIHTTHVCNIATGPLGRLVPHPGQCLFRAA